MAYRRFGHGDDQHGDHRQRAGATVVADPLPKREVAGGCNVSGCICDGLMGYGDLCENCRHHKDYHY